MGFGMIHSRRVQRLALLLGVAAAAAVVWLLWPRPSDEKLILDLVAKAEHGVETKNAQEIMSCVALDYHDPSGLTRADIFRLAMHWQKTSEQADVSINQYQLDIRPPAATGQFEVDLLLSQGGQAGQPERLKLAVEFQKERRGLFGRAWVVRSVSGHGLGRDFEGLL